MNEQNYFNLDGITVSNQRVVAVKNTYLIEDIVSARMGIEQPNQGYGIFFILTGLLLLLEEDTLFAVGGVLLATGMVILVAQVSKYAVFISTPEKEHRVYLTYDRLLAEKILHAIDLALLNRIDPITKATERNHELIHTTATPKAEYLRSP